MHAHSITRLALCLPLALLIGCPSDEQEGEGAAASTTVEDPTVAADGTSSTTESPPLPDTDTDPHRLDTDTDTDTNGTIAGCECILDEDVGPQDSRSPSAPICGEQVCPRVAAAHDTFTKVEEDAFELADPAALECALLALRDRTPGIVTWSFDEDYGFAEFSGYVLVNEDGTAVRRSWGWEDLGYEASEAELGELSSPEHFDACLADPDAYARFDCLREDLGPVVAVCDEGWWDGYKNKP